MYTTEFIIGVKRKLEKTRIFWYVFLLLNLIRQHEKPKRYINSATSHIKPVFT